MNVRRISKETDNFVKLAWDPVPGADGYRFYSSGVLRSKTMDPMRTTVKFSKGQEPYRVEAIVLSHLDEDSWPDQQIPPQPTGFIKVAPRVAYKDGGSDARFCCNENQPGVVRDGDGWKDEVATYDANGLCRNGRRSDGPAVTGALNIDGREYCSLPTMGDPTKNTGSWAV